jgi:hypothetical protein
MDNYDGKDKLSFLHPIAKNKLGNPQDYILEKRHD